MKIIKYLLPLLLIPVVAWGQTTHPVTSTYPIANDRASAVERGLSGLLPASSSIWGRGSALDVNSFSPNMTDGVDSVYFPEDSLSNLSGETVYTVTVKGINYKASVTNNTDNGRVGSDTTLSVLVDKRAYGIDSTATMDVWKNGANRNIIDDLGITFESDVSVGDEVRIAITYDTPIAVDKSTHALMTIDYGHHEKHTGSAYHVSVDSALAGADDTLSVAIVTPNSDTKLHLIWEASVSAKCWFFVKSGPTLGVASDTVTIYNDDLGSANTSGATVIKAPRTAATGTRIWTQLLGSTNKAGNLASRESEVILAKNTTYVIGVHSTAAADASIILHWYEHRNK